MENPHITDSNQHSPGTFKPQSQLTQPAQSSQNPSQNPQSIRPQPSVTPGDIANPPVHPKITTESNFD